MYYIFRALYIDLNFLYVFFLFYDKPLLIQNMLARSSTTFTYKQFLAKREDMASAMIQVRPSDIMAMKQDNRTDL